MAWAQPASASDRKPIPAIRQATAERHTRLSGGGSLRWPRGVSRGLLVAFEVTGQHQAKKHGQRREQDDAAGDHARS